MKITDKTVLDDKQKAAYERAKFFSSMYFDFFLETNPSGRQYIKAILTDEDRIIKVIIVDVELCEWIHRKDEAIRYENQDNIVPIKLLEEKVPIWVKAGTETGEDKKGWYYLENNNKVYVYKKV